MRSKIVALLAVAVIISIVISLSLHFRNRYYSAFEADQECHSDLAIEYSQAPGIDCDHDLETRQWLLFELGLDSAPAKVLKRYKY